MVLSAGASSAAEEHLERLLEEASHAHEALDRLMSNRPAPQNSPPADTSTSVTAQLVRATVDAIHAGSQPPPELFGGVSSRSRLPLVTSEADERSRPRLQLAHRHDPELSIDVSSSGPLPSSSAPDRTFRMMVRLRRELKEAHSSIRELRLENDALRGALDHQRSSLRTESELRLQLEEARRAAVEMESTRAVEQRAMADLNFFLRESEAERERLRTLLQGTVHHSPS